ncbi:hypothetical protein ACLOJK_040201 [Asimina triloba]
MDPGERMIFCHPRIFFDPSTFPHSSIHPKPDTHFADSNLSKVFQPSCSVEKLAGSSFGAQFSPVFAPDGTGISSAFSEVVEMEEMNGSDHASDANTTQIGGELSEESEYCDGLHEIFCRESVKRKLELLASMVGVGSSQPAEVLTEVVRTLKDLERKWRIVSEGAMRSSGAKW